jgi:hypothetical protein
MGMNFVLGLKHGNKQESKRRGFCIFYDSRRARIVDAATRPAVSVLRIRLPSETGMSPFF